MSHRVHNRSNKALKYPSHQRICVITSFKAYNQIGIEPGLQIPKSSRPLTRIQQKKITQQKTNHIIDRDNLIKQKNIIIPKLIHKQSHLLHNSNLMRIKNINASLSGRYRLLYILYEKIILL